MNRTVMTYMLATIVALSAIAGFSMQPFLSVAQAQVTTQHDEPAPRGLTPVEGFEAISPSCGQVIDQDVRLTSNLECTDSDGLIVGQTAKIDLNGYSIIGPGQESSKVGIMVPNHANVEIIGGSIIGFQAGILASGADALSVEKVIFEGNQIGAFMTGSTLVEIRKSLFDENQIGIAAHSTQNSIIALNTFDGNSMAGITLVNSDSSEITMNNIASSENAIFIDNQSNQNEITYNNAILTTMGLNHANGLPVNTAGNNFAQNNCLTSNPSGLCVGG